MLNRLEPAHEILVLVALGTSASSDKVALPHRAVLIEHPKDGSR